MSLDAPQPAEMRRKLLYGGSVAALVVFVGLGVFAKNGWLPHTDPLTGKKSGWFGQDLPKNAGSTWNPLAAPLPTATPQLSKEYIYAGSRLLAVEDANANAAPPADIGVWRPSTGVWYVLSAQSQVTIAGWGQSGDVPVQGDYDGDGKTDFSIYRPSNNTWYILRSGDNGVTITTWGNDANDTPITSDFDGDGKTDIAVYRITTGGWYILRSSDAQVYSASWGTAGDVPAPADYDGDGKADVAVWRGSTLSFYALSLVNNNVMQATFSGASSGDKPVPADYDGDGKANFAIRHNADWLIMNAAGTSTTTTTPSGDQASDVPVPNDYDGDGKVDIAVWRPTDSPTGTLGHWYIRKSGSSGALRDESWGTTGDIPVPAYFRR